MGYSITGTLKGFRVEEEITSLEIPWLGFVAIASTYFILLRILCYHHCCGGWCLNAFLFFVWSFSAFASLVKVKIWTLELFGMMDHLINSQTPWILKWSDETSCPLKLCLPDGQSLGRKGSCNEAHSSYNGASMISKDAELQSSSG